MYHSMPHRDPQTGEFVSAEEMERFDDIEVVTITAGAGVEASNLSGATSFEGTSDPFEGLQILDYDEIVDRNEKLVLLSAHHSVSVFANSTESADGTVGCAVEVSSSPTRQSNGFVTGTAQYSASDSEVVGAGSSTDTIDILGRVLTATAGAPFSDSASGVGGGGSAGEDSYEVDDIPRQMAEFHPRDELFLNGEFQSWNVDDSGIHVTFTGQHIYGVVSE